MLLGVGAVGAFGEILSSTGKNNRGLVQKWDMWTAATEVPNPVCVQNKVKGRVKICQVQGRCLQQ